MFFDNRYERIESFYVFAQTCITIKQRKWHFLFSQKNLNPQIKGINLQKWAKFDCFFNFLINCALNVSDFLHDALDKFTLKSDSFIFYPKILLTPSEGYFNFTHLYTSLPLFFWTHESIYILKASDSWPADSSWQSWNFVALAKQRD